MAFKDFPDQAGVVELLQRSLEKGRLGHAYLFSGESLESLEAVAGALAKTLNCQNPPKCSAFGLGLDCCDQCLSCRKISGYTHPDVQWVRPESKIRIITIDQVRELLATIHLKPTEGLYKVGVIVGADRLNIQAANAFLKTLEEPPPRTVFILLSTEVQRLLETINSRCLRLNFSSAGLVRHQAFLDWLGAFVQMASVPQKSLLTRYKLLGIVLSKLASLKEETEKTLTERSPLEQYEDLDPHLKEKWEDELSAAIEAEYRWKRSELLAAVQAWLRDVWLHTLGSPNEILNFPVFEEASAKVAKRLNSEDAAANLAVIDHTQRILHTNVQEALALEVGLLKLKF